jgi:hypothetical protein
MTIHFSNIPATFRHCRRVGSTSFKFWVFDNFPNAEVMSDPENKNAGLLDMSLDEVKQKWPDYGTTFGFVRNPYDRLVSIFHWFGQTSSNRIINRVKDSVPVAIDLQVLLRYNKGFDYWIRNLHPSNDMDIFYYPQPQMYHFNCVAPDLVVKLENIETDFVKIQDLLKCDAPLIHRNASSHNDYRSYYNSETKEIARKLMEMDLDTFGYTF